MKQIEGCTRKIYEGKRGEEIQQYMTENHIDKEQIIIFDDDRDMLHLSDRLIKTNFHYGGLCYRHLLRAWKMLEND